MSATTQSSDIYAIQVATNSNSRNPAHDAGGKLVVFRFAFTQSGTGDAGSYANLFKLPPGKFRYLGNLSKIYFAALGTARTMDVGFSAHTNADGTAVVADPNGLHDGEDVSSAGSAAPVGALTGDGTYLFDSREGVVISAQINDGTITDGKTLKGIMVFSKEG